MLKNLLKTKKQKLRQEYEDKVKEIKIEMFGEQMAIAWLNLKVKSEGLDSLAYELMCDLAEEGKDNAIFCLHTQDNEKSQHIVLDLLDKNKRYARNRVHKAYHDNEAWIDELFTWNKNAQNEVHLTLKKNAQNPINFIDAVNEGNPLAVEKFSSQFTDPESTERLNIIKSILCLHDDRYSTTLISTHSKFIPFKESYKCKPILPELEKKLFNQLHLALKKNPKLNEERLLLAECYKHGIGTEKNLVKSIKNLFSYNWSAGDGTRDNYNALKNYVTGLKKVTLPKITISKSELHNVQMYPDTSEVFIKEQSWLEKHFMPIMKVDLGILEPEWKNTNFPICIAYEPDPSNKHIGETTKDFHNDYTCVGWYAFKLNENNQYEFLGDEKFFKYSSHLNNKDTEQARQDFKDRKAKYLETGNFFREQFKDGKSSLEPIDDVYLELGGSNYGHDFTYLPPEFFCYIPDCGIATAENKPMYHITTFKETTLFAEYYRVGSVGIFFDPDSRMVLYSCKHIRIY